VYSITGLVPSYVFSTRGKETILLSRSNPFLEPTRTEQR